MNSIDRTLKKTISADLKSKIVILSGPRQCGKTTLSKNLGIDYEYINFDSDDDQKTIKDKSWDRKKDLIVLDEIHKMNNWKKWLKGIYDTEHIPPGILVTGSARMDLYRKTGDSLAGRFFSHRLHPFDIKELSLNDPEINPEAVLDQLLITGGFPEPFLNGTGEFHRRWKKSHVDVILRQDLIDLESVKNIRSIELLLGLLKYRVGSPVSYASLARDLQVDPKTVKSWLEILENLYVIFKVTPYHRNIARSLLKEPKYYFYDTGLVEGDEGIKLENQVACSLLKELQFIEDVQGLNTKIHYLRNKDGREIDFFIEIDKHNKYLIEVKLSDDNLSGNLDFFSKYIPGASKIQLVKNLKKEKTFPDGAEIRRAAHWLNKMELVEDL
jgi:hypothetical protein